MKVDDIHWHDAEILEVRENAESDTLTYILNYPADWSTNTFEKKEITFHGHLNHSISEGPFSGCPTILEANVVETKTHFGSRLVHIEIKTNAGKRNLWFSKIETDI